MAEGENQQANGCAGLPNARVPVFGFAAFSGTGKTTLLIRLIPALIETGLRVGLIKHSHHAFEIDVPGKDSFELRQAGASPVMISSAKRRAVIVEHPNSVEPSLDQELSHLDQTDIDLILVEGFRDVPFPKIELHRPELRRPLLYPNDPSIIALATNAPNLLPDASLPILDLDAPSMIARFIIDRYVQS